MAGTSGVRAQADERSMWQKIILPRLGKLKIASIDADHIDQLHRDITNVRETPVRANRVIEVLGGGTGSKRPDPCTPSAPRAEVEPPDALRRKYASPGRE